jgi:hypothetical protein
MIRSVYQAVRPMLYKQPGDSMVFLIERDGKSLEASVVLGGGIELPSAPFANVRQYLRPTLDVRQIGEGMYTARRSQDTIGEVFAPQPLAARRSKTATAPCRLPRRSSCWNGLWNDINKAMPRSCSSVCTRT